MGHYPRRAPQARLAAHAVTRYCGGMADDEGHEALLAKAREDHRTPTSQKRRAQDILLHGIAVALGYWTEQNYFDVAVLTEKQQDEFSRILQQQADRVARLFGYENAWSA